MAKLKITNLPPYDGEYEIPSAGWTNRELHFIKQTSGVRAGELEDAMRAGDMGVLVALSVVILRRAGVLNVNIDALWDSTAESFDVVADDEQEDDRDRPPDSAIAGGNENASDYAISESENGSSSGASHGAHIGENSQPTPSATGDPGSETSAVFGQMISES